MQKVRGQPMTRQEQDEALNERRMLKDQIYEGESEIRKADETIRGVEKGIQNL